MRSCLAFVLLANVVQGTNAFALGLPSLSVPQVWYPPALDALTHFLHSSCIELDLEDCLHAALGWHLDGLPLLVLLVVLLDFADGSPRNVMLDGEFLLLGMSVLPFCLFVLLGNVVYLTGDVARANSVGTRSASFSSDTVPGMELLTRCCTRNPFHCVLWRSPRRLW
jgi:hypothetical protein